MLRRVRAIRRSLRQWAARLKSRQRGAILFIALIVLVAMTLAGIALVRSVDTANVIAGNVALRRSATHSGDAGTEAAIAWLAGNSAGTTLFTDHYDQGYVANGLAYQDPPPGENWDAFWNSTLAPAGQVRSLPVDSAGNTVSYVIHRLCYNAGDPNATATGCASNLAQTAAGQGSSMGAAFIALQGSTQVYYRITTRIAGPKSTVSYVQAIIAM